jgi:hypothetical protein
VFFEERSLLGAFGGSDIADSISDVFGVTPTNAVGLLW